MVNFDRQHLLRVSASIAIFLLLAVIGLWSFNTLSGLVDGPQAEYRHALATLGLVLALRFCLTVGRRRHGCEGSRACQQACAGK